MSVSAPSKQWCSKSAVKLQVGPCLKGDRNFLQRDDGKYPNWMTVLSAWLLGMDEPPHKGAVVSPGQTSAEVCCYLANRIGKPIWLIMELQASHLYDLIDTVGVGSRDIFTQTSIWSCHQMTETERSFCAEGHKSSFFHHWAWTDVFGNQVMMKSFVPVIDRAVDTVPG